MWILLLEALLALAIFVLIVGWTMWPKRSELRRERPGDAADKAQAPKPGKADVDQ